MIFSGSSVCELSRRIVRELRIEQGTALVDRFSDGEVNVEIRENVRGKDVFIVQSTCAPTNDNIMELLIMADAIRRASAQRITAVIPYFGYARQDRRVRSARVPISAKVVADALTGVGIDRIMTVDLHADQIQGFFNVPVSPDVGGVVRARALAKQINDVDLAIIDKRRDRANESEVMNIIGDVDGRTAILVDDMVDTAGTLCNAARALKSQGAWGVVAYITHAVLSGDAVKRIEASDIDEMVVTDTIPLFEEAARCGKIRQRSLDRVLAEAIRRVSNEESVSAMFRLGPS